MNFKHVVALIITLVLGVVTYFQGYESGVLYGVDRAKAEQELLKGLLSRKD